MPETNNQIEGSTLTNDQELYEHLNFSEEEIETDQQQKIGERIDVNDHILLDGMISNHQNEFSKLPDDIKIPSEKIRNIHDDNPMNKLLCLHKGKLYYIENLDPQKGEKKAYVIAEEVWYGDKRLFQASIQHNINQTLIKFPKMTKNKKNGTRTLLASPSLVYNIIKNNEIFENAKETQGIARTVAQPDPTYIGERLKIGTPEYGTRDPEMKVQLMLHEDKLYQIDRQNKQSKVLADKVEYRDGIIFKRNDQGLRMVLFSRNNLKESHNIGLIKSFFTKEKRETTQTTYVSADTLENINQRLQYFKNMEKKDQIESKPWPEVDVDSISSLKKLKIVKDPNLHNDKDLIYYDYDKSALYKLEINDRGKVQKAYLLTNKHLDKQLHKSHLALNDINKNIKLNLFPVPKLFSGLVWTQKGEVEKKVAYFIEFQKTITHENRNKDVYTLLLKDTNLYLVDHKSKVAIKVAANVNFEDGKIKSDNKILLSNLSPNENMKWPISSYKASKIYEIAKINQSRNIPQLSNNVVELQKRSKGKSQTQRELLNQNQKMDTRSCVSIGERPGTSR
ncbi:hypothetical protein ACG7HM_000569 [Enterococcus hirae]|uniref:hypothetical protein n=1 Tax=Enterococcus hirae TaxID=1354 RepID=UPI000DEA3531|nr:hypothetical protein [Enterococcus hirae]EMF0385785.1 hypothetical protein [Enterococcus hirae]EMF0426222.1 hypothetical protein [Enterococcus hirae]EMF0484521.1 hypothetical protein [Enterococcus hirae]RBT42914.1 hypothetical protein EB07_01222 [Enterococcus hirae]RBT48856.1 hypothetical protein EB20_00958 [Enterococcus hirae]